MGFYYVVVRYGRKSEQLALHCGVAASGRVLVKKWRKNGRRWTDVLHIKPAEVLRQATPEDVQRFHPEAPPLE